MVIAVIVSFISTQSATIPEGRLSVRSWNVETAFEKESNKVCKSLIFVAFRYAPFTANAVSSLSFTSPNPIEKLFRFAGVSNLSTRLSSVIIELLSIPSVNDTIAHPS